MGAPMGARWSIPLLAGALAGGCARHTVRYVQPPPPLPELTVPVAPVERARPAPGADALAGRPPGSLVTLSARDVDVRVLLVALAEQAGISLVLDPEVSGRTSVNLTNVPALEALRAVLAAAGLSVYAGPPEPPVGPTVFFAAPIDIERASDALIAERFGVSPEMAEWIVETRLEQPAR